jgi:hypothetical protein
MVEQVYDEAFSLDRSHHKSYLTSITTDDDREMTSMALQGMSPGGSVRAPPPLEGGGVGNLQL